MGTACGMTHDHNGDTQFLAKVLNNDRSRTGLRDPVTATHTSAFIYQQSNRHIDRFSW